MGFIKETTLFAANLEKDLAGKDIEYGKLVDNLLLQCLGEDLDDLPEDGDVFFAAFRRKYHLLKLVFQKLLVVNYDFFVRSVLFGNTYAREEDIRLAKEKGLLTKIPAEELYSFFIHFNSDASYVLFRDLDCPLTEVELLRTSLADRNKDLFVETFNRIKCDKSSLYFVAGCLGTAFEFIMKAFVEPQDVYNYLYCTIPNGIPAIIRNSVPGFKEQIESYIKSYKGDDNVDENKRPSSKEELQVLEQNALQSMDGSILTTLSSAKQVIIEMERVSELFPFEKAYVDSIVNNPELQPYFEQLPDTVDTYSEPEEETIVDDVKQSGVNDGEKKSNAGATHTSRKDAILPEGSTQSTIAEEQSENEGLHWPTDEELEGYENNYNSSEYFAESIFGVAPNIKASDVEQLYNCLTQPKLKVLEDNLETKLIFLSRYTGKKIPHLELRQLEWKVLNDGDKALGYLIKTTGAGKFATGIKFFYYLGRNGEKTQFERKPVAEGGHAWANAGRQEKTRGRFEKELNRFIEKYQEEHSE